MLTSSKFLVLGVLEVEVPGNFKFNAFGATKVEVSMKNINNRNIMSVIEDILNSAETFVFFFNPMVKNLWVGWQLWLSF